MLEFDTAFHSCKADPDRPGWHILQGKDKTLFPAQFGPFGLRRDGDHAILQLRPHPGLNNFSGYLHGGALATFIDVAMFAGSMALSPRQKPGGLTVDMSIQFAGTATDRHPVDAVVQITRETGRMIFVRGTIEQEGETLASFVGILRKPS